MISIRQAVIVEGKYDKIRLSSILDALILTTDGFAIFKDKEKMNLIRRLAASRGIVILTDSDSAGFLIRSHLMGSIPKEQIVNAYIPDVYGREKRKTSPGKEGKLGVEGMPSDVLLQALQHAGVTCGTGRAPRRPVTKADLYADGLSGGENSQRKRRALCRRLGLPERLSQNALLEVLNGMIPYEEYRQAVEQLGGTQQTG